MKTVAIIAFLAIAPATLQAQFCGERLTAMKDAMPVMGMRIGTPVIVSFYGGPTLFAGSVACRSYVQSVIEAGIGGGQVGFAYGIGRRETSVRIQTSALRTWGPSWQAPSNETFAGAELQVSYTVGIRAGIFRRLGGGAGSRRLFTLGTTLGF